MSAGGPKRDSVVGSATGVIPPQGTLSLLVGPATSSERNTVRLPLVPIACWRLADVRFEFDSSFVQPGVAKEFAKLAKLCSNHPGAPLSVFGHADPVGEDDYNKMLSGRRAQAIYAVLIRDTARWEKLYTTPLGRDDWAASAVQRMLPAVGFEGQTPKAVKAFQGANGLAADGTAGPLTRAKLFQAYMDTICRDESDAPFQLKKEDFLARGVDAQGKGDYQGCGELNPLLLLSKSENQTLPAAARNVENAPNRRVMVLLFRPGSTIASDRWPCPRASEGIAGCKKRLWSDAKKRRAFGSERREYPQSGDTFACRFYDRLTGDSPCEKPILRTAELQWVSYTPRPEIVPTLAACSPTGEEIARIGNHGTVTDEQGVCYHAFDLSSLKARPALSLKAVSGEASIVPTAGIDLLRSLAALPQLESVLSAFGLSLPPRPPSQPPPEPGPPLPDLPEIPPGEPLPEDVPGDDEF